MAVNPTTVTTPYLGETVYYDPKHRAYAVPYSQVDAPSYIPQSLLKISDKADYKKNSESLATTPVVTSKLLEDLSDDIANHFETRIQLMFQQILLVYKTNYTFIDRTRADKQNGQAKGDFAAAHSSTLPSLYILVKNKVVAFAMKSYFERSWNATVWLPKCANDVDGDLDKTSRKLNKSYSFRYFCLNLLAQSGVNDYHPKQCLQSFLIEAIDNLNEMSSLYEKAPFHKSIVDIYLKVATSYQKSLLEGDSIIKKLCFKNIEKCDEKFYTVVAKELQDRLLGEMDQVKPILVPLPLTITNLTLDPKRFTKVIQSKYVEFGLSITKKGEEYVNYCITKPTTRAEVLRYFGVVNDETTLTGDLLLITQIKTKKSFENSAFPSRITNLYNRIFNEITERFFGQAQISSPEGKTKEIRGPQKMNGIIFKILEIVSTNPVASLAHDDYAWKILKGAKYM